jgi:hypothetical protein
VPLNLAEERLTRGQIPRDLSNFTCIYWQIDIGFLIDFTDPLWGMLPEGSTFIVTENGTVEWYGEGVSEV